MTRHNGRPELWGGVECTVNRIGDRYRDQLELTGHAARPSDLDLAASLGFRALRYPVLWERVTAHGWAWSDERLRRLRELDMRPIVGLVHHGSGPRSTSLLEESFATGLAAHARLAAERYPWVEDWTPVNEPLTTARFAALYGHWYPHARDDPSFARALLVQCRAVILAMQAVREVVPGARLVQTEDLGKTHAMPALSYQAAFENERRWASLDLLSGRLTEDSPFGAWLVRAAGVDPAELAWFREHACPPDVVGVNHYLTSERFLDENLAVYPLESHGGNGRQRYADVAAVRVLGRGADGIAGILRESWDRYRRPVAVTEAHNGCTREEQLRWLHDAWRAAVALRAAGADVRAVTVWSLFGAAGWASLAAGDAAAYEPGPFDTRGPTPRATALARLAASLAEDGRADDHLLAHPGWWRRPLRIEHPAVGRIEPAPRPARRTPPLLVTGATGTLGRAFARLCRLRGLPHRVTSRRELDAADPRSVARALHEVRPWAVVNAAGYVRVDDAETDAARCHRENTDAAAVLAAACAARELPLVTFSSDLVFDGNTTEPYVEDDAVAPLGVYGRSKADAEERVLAAHPSALVVRTSAFFGPWDRANFVTIALERMRRGEPVAAAGDTVVSPTYVPDLVNATLDLLIDAEGGIWHIANAQATTWAELARKAAARAGIRALVRDVPAAGLGLVAPRPRYSALGSARGTLLGTLDDALHRYVAATSALAA